MNIHTHTDIWHTAEEGGPVAETEISCASSFLCHTNLLSVPYTYCALLCLFLSHPLLISLTPMWNFPSKRLVNDGAISCIFKRLTGIFHWAGSTLRSRKQTFRKSQQGRLVHLHLSTVWQAGISGFFQPLFFFFLFHPSRCVKIKNRIKDTKQIVHQFIIYVTLPVVSAFRSVCYKW